MTSWEPDDLVTRSLTAPAFIRVELPYATFGLLARGGVVTDAPPIAAWARGKLVWRVCGYYRRKGALVTVSPDPAGDRP